MHFGEVVLKTSQYDALKSWYSQVLDTKPMFESERREQPAPVGMRQMCLIPTIFGLSFHRDTGDSRCPRITAK